MESLSGILPANVMVEILAYLPVWSLIRFRCVSKSWRAFLSEPYFVTMWLNRSGTSLLVVPLEGTHLDQCSLVFENVSIGKKNLNLPLENTWSSLSMIGSSSDGALVCLAGLSHIGRHASKQAVILWTPFTGEVKTLKNLGCIHCERWPICTESVVLGYNSACCNQYLVHGFGYEPNARDHKVVRITYSRGIGRQLDTPVRPRLVEVYSLSSDTWKNLGRPSFTWTVRGNSRAFLNGSAHWLAAPAANAPYNSVVAFNMKDETFGEAIELPQSEDLSQFSLNPRGKVTLSVSRGSLALIAFGVWNSEECGIWVMKEYGVAESWTKQHHIVLPTGLSTVRAALGLTGHGKILLRLVDEKVVCCDAEEVQISEVGIQGSNRDLSFDVFDLGGGDPSLGSQGGRGSLLNHSQPPMMN